jgi:hypothetical protein
MRTIAMWLFNNVPLGFAAPHVFGFAMGVEYINVDEYKKDHD